MADYLDDSIMVYTLLQELRLNGSEKSTLVHGCSNYLQQKTEFVLCGDEEITDGDTEIIIEALKNNATITNLHLRNFKRGELYGQISQLVDCNKSIVELRLTFNEIDKNSCCIALANSMKTNTTIADLDICLNNIKCEGAMVLAEGLKVNNTLNLIDLVGNGIGSDGGIAIASALAINTSLEYLDLSINELGDEAAIQLACALVRNKKLKFLNLRYNCIGTEGCKAILGALRISNTTLYDCDLSDNEQIDNYHLNILAQYFEFNNRERRGVLLTDRTTVTRQQQVEALIYNRHSIEIFFEALLLRPDLCNPDESDLEDDQSTSASTRKRKHVALRSSF